MIEVRRDDEIHEEEVAGSRPAGTSRSTTTAIPVRWAWAHCECFNDDRLVPGADWPIHPHADVEGLTYVVEGTLEHADSLSGGTLLRLCSVGRHVYLDRPNPR